jgi:transposase InsO family protein
MTIKPHIIQSDNGSEFKNYYTINWYKENDIQYIFTLPYAPESNGLIENFNKDRVS